MSLGGTAGRKVSGRCQPGRPHVAHRESSAARRGGSRRDRPSRVARDERAAGAAAAIGGVVAIVSVLGGVRLAVRLLTRRTSGIEPMFPSLQHEA